MKKTVKEFYSDYPNFGFTNFSRKYSIYILIFNRNFLNNANKGKIYKYVNNTIILNLYFL